MGWFSEIRSKLELKKLRKKVILAENSDPGKHTRWGYNCHLGEFSYIRGGEVYPNTYIGKYCSISTNVTLGALQHSLTRLTTAARFLGYAKKIRSEIETSQKKASKYETIIEHDVWIGVNAVIMSGLKINVGAVIGAGAVVTRDVPPYAIVGGVPAKIIRYRFDEETIQQLIELNWWNIAPQKIANVTLSDIHKAIEEIQMIKKRELNKYL